MDLYLRHFLEILQKKMSEQQIILQCTDNVNVGEDENHISMSLDMNLTDIDMSELPCLENTTYDDKDSSKVQTDGENKTRDWFNSIIDRNCYKEHVQFCTVQLLEALEKAKNDWNEKSIVVILTTIARTDKKYIVDELLAVIKKDFYDVFCVRNIIKIIDEIFQVTPPTHYRFMYQDLQDVKKQFQKIKTQWCQKSSFQISNNCCLEFDRSQQIVHSCNDCLNTISLRSS